MCKRSFDRADDAPSWVARSRMEGATPKPCGGYGRWPSVVPFGTAKTAQDLDNWAYAPDIAVMRAALALAAALIATPCLAAERLPTFPKKTEYAEARRSLAALGWAPVTMPDADKCDSDDQRCQGRPEMAWCSGTGRARCGFTWRRGDRLITVVTAGEEDPFVIGVECRSGC